MNREERRRGAAYHGWKVLSGVCSSTAIRADVGSDRWAKKMESDDTVSQTEQKKPWNEQCILILNEENEQENAKQFHV